MQGQWCRPHTRIHSMVNLYIMVIAAASFLGFLGSDGSISWNPDRFLPSKAFLGSTITPPVQRRQRRLQQKPKSSAPVRATPQRLLYVVTSMAEFDSGRRQTQKGYDRFTHTLVPVIQNAVRSMVQTGYVVDLYLIAHYNVNGARRQQLKSQLPPGVGLQIWQSATPLGYALEHSKETIMEITRGLARQHRYVIKDKFFHYDMFVNFEDDMMVRGPHVRQFLETSDALFTLRQSTKGSLADKKITVAQAKDIFYGAMTTQQLARTIPGFIRVEAALPSFERPRHNRFDQIPIDYTWEGKRASIDSSVCCHVSSATANEHIPAAPDKDSLFFWETSIEALGVRHIPTIEWVTLLGGSNNEIWEDPAFVMGDFWSGRDSNYFGKSSRPDRKEGRYFSNQGGWMGTRRQLSEWHCAWCRGGFLPPFDLPHYKFDGLDLRSVEYWSGGIQLAGINSCNLQRVVALDPTKFSSQILYHTSNNKQQTRRIRDQFSGRSINEFWGQLNTIRKTAAKRMQFELLTG